MFLMKKEEEELENAYASILPVPLYIYMSVESADLNMAIIIIVVNNPYAHRNGIKQVKEIFRGSVVSCKESLLIDIIEDTRPIIFCVKSSVNVRKKFDLQLNPKTGEKFNVFDMKSIKKERDELFYKYNVEPRNIY